VIVKKGHQQYEMCGFRQQKNERSSGTKVQEERFRYRYRGRVKYNVLEHTREGKKNLQRPDGSNNEKELIKRRKKEIKRRLLRKGDFI